MLCHVGVRLDGEAAQDAELVARVSAQGLDGPTMGHGHLEQAVVAGRARRSFVQGNQLVVIGRDRQRLF